MHQCKECQQVSLKEPCFVDSNLRVDILSDNGKESSSASVAYIADELGFTKVYPSPYSPSSNSVIERGHDFLKKSIRKLRCNYETCWDYLVHIAVMACNIFPHTTTGESLFFLMYG